MSDRNGWIKIHRKMLDNPIVFKDPDHLAVWMYLLLEATHKSYQTVFGGKPFVLVPGQLLTGRLKISRETKVEQHKVDRILKLFKSAQLIEQRAERYGSLVSIVNWSKYQECEQQSEQRLSNERATSEQRVSTIQEDKNVKNKRNTISSNKLSDEFDELWEMYPRKEGKKKAKDAYIRARKNGTSFEDVMNGIRNYQNHIEQTGMDRKYTKMGSTYFNGRCWEDRFETVESVEDILARWGNDNQ